MEHTYVYKGWRRSVINADNKVPLILIGVLVGLFTFTLGEKMHWHFQHHLHDHWLHFLSNHVFMWIFFLYLGIEISISEVVKAGKFVALSTLGGMVIPPLFAYLLTGNVYIAVGAAATDVAFSVGASKIFTQGKAVVMTLMTTALLILAVGDDMGGIGIMAGMFADNISQFWLGAEVFVLAFTYFCGERGVMDFKVQEKGKPETLRHYQWVVEIQSPFFWLFLAGLNTFVLYMAGVEWILGGCLAFIMAPAHAKHTVERFLKPFIPLVLIVFGLVNGAIDLLASESWGMITAGCFFGGMFGKQVGIFAGGLLGRMWSRSSEGEDVYGHIPTQQIYGLSVLASCNGTVAIFFVAMALSKGFVTPEMAAQATLGYFLTVPAVYLQAIVLKAFKAVRDVAEFQPDLAPHQETLTTEAA